MAQYAGDYDWSNVRCTAEAYGDDRSPPVTPPSKRNRALHFHSEWMDVAEARECLVEIGDLYNTGHRGFDPEAVNEVLGSLTVEVQVVVARETMPTLYLWTNQPVPVMEALAEMPGQPSTGVFLEENGQELHSDAPADAPSSPLLMAYPDAASYPILENGKPKSEIENGRPTLVVAQWEHAGTSRVDG